LIGIYLFRYFFILKAPYLSIGWSEISEHGKNQMGLYLAIVTPFIFWKNIYEKFSFYNLLSLLIHISAVLYTLSRGTWISLFASIVVATIIFLTKKEKLKINLNFIRNFFLGILIVAVLFFYFYSKLPFSDVFRLRLQSIFSLEDYANRRSISLRKEYIRTSIDYFAGNPLFGIGTSNFYGFTLFVNHNDYLQILCEQGIIGFVTFLGILFVILYCLFNVNIKEYESLSLINSSLSIILYFNFVNTYNVIIIYVIWSMLLRQNLRRKM